MAKSMNILGLKILFRLIVLLIIFSNLTIGRYVSHRVEQHFSYRIVEIKNSLSLSEIKTAL